MSISATIITLNEEESIGNVIQSLQGLADEIIVIDSGSSDKTVEIARKLGAKVYFREFDNFANQKNWAASEATKEWILAVDADEEITSELANEIKEAIKAYKYQGYLMPRRNFILNKEIKHSRWSPDTHVWLWQKGYGKWVGDVHEEVVIKGNVGLLKNSKIHHSHKTVSSFMKANNSYSSLEARALFRNNIRFSFWKMWREAIFEFFIRYIYKKGFLDKKEGFALSFLMSIYKLSVWIKLWELEK